MKNNTPFFKIISIIGVISVGIFFCSIAFSAPQDLRVPLLFSRHKEYKNIRVQIKQRIKALKAANPGLTSLLIEEEANIKSKSLGRYIRNLVIKPRDEGWFHRLLKALDRLEAGKPDWINVLRIGLTDLTWQQLKGLNVYTIEELQNISFEAVANFGSNSIREIEQLRIKSGGMKWFYPYRSSEQVRKIYLIYYGYSPGKITRRFDSERKGIVKAMANSEQIRKMPEKVTFYDFSEEIKEADALVRDPLSTFFPMLLLERLEKAQMLYWQVQAGLQTYDGILNESKERG